MYLVISRLNNVGKFPIDIRSLSKTVWGGPHWNPPSAVHSSQYVGHVFPEEHPSIPHADLPFQSPSSSEGKSHGLSLSVSWFQPLRNRLPVSGGASVFSKLPMSLAAIAQPFSMKDKMFFSPLKCQSLPDEPQSALLCLAWGANKIHIPLISPSSSGWGGAMTCPCSEWRACLAEFLYVSVVAIHLHGQISKFRSIKLTIWCPRAGQKIHKIMTKYFKSKLPCLHNLNL